MCVAINDHSNKLSKATFFAETKFKLKAGYTLMSNPFHHSSTANVETGITGIKDDTRYKLSAVQAHLQNLVCADEHLPGIKSYY